MASSNSADNFKQQKAIAKELISKYDVSDNSATITIIQNRPTGHNVIKDETMVDILLKTMAKFPYEGKMENINEAIQLATDLYKSKTNSGPAAEENSLIVFLTNTSVNAMTPKELQLLKEAVSKGISVVFVVSGSLVDSSEASLVDVLGSRKKIVYIFDTDDVVDGDAVNNLLKKGTYSTY